MLHRTIFVLMVELIILPFYSLPGLFSSNGCAVLSLNLGGRGESALKYLHHKDKMILSSCFHSLCRVQER